MSFQEQVKQWTLKQQITTERQARAVALSLFAKVVIRTPVGKPWTWKYPHAPKGYVGGRARGNWQISFGHPSATPTETHVGDDKASATAHVSGQLPKLDLSKPLTVWLSNALPYMKRLEYDSWSKQAPNGMVRVSMAEIGAIARDAE